VRVKSLPRCGPDRCHNNTVAILISGGLTRDIAYEHSVPSARAASVLDIFACMGVLPYGAQIQRALRLAARCMAIDFMRWPSRQAA
jgi:hypothetical protein